MSEDRKVTRLREKVRTAESERDAMAAKVRKLEHTIVALEQENEMLKQHMDAMQGEYISYLDELRKGIDEMKAARSCYTDATKRVRLLEKANSDKFEKLIGELRKRSR